MIKLSDLDFSDLYMRVDDTSPARYSPRVVKMNDGVLGNMQLPIEYEMEVDLIRKKIAQFKDRKDFSIDWDEMRFRVSVATMFGEEVWASLRRLPLEPPEIDDLGFTPGDLNLFKAWGKRQSGLVVVGGATGAGKTTTSVALLIEWLKTHGKVAYTIEDPIEFALQGEHFKEIARKDEDGNIIIEEIGGNYCFQREVSTDNEWGDAVKQALRWKPRYIFIGEVRTQQAAQGILRAATSGHMTLCTVHGGSVEETISAIVQNAISGPMGMQVEQVYSLLADGLCGIIHQKLIGNKPSLQIINTDTNSNCKIRRALKEAGKTGKSLDLQSAINSQHKDRNSNN